MAAQIYPTTDTPGAQGSTGDLFHRPGAGDLRRRQAGRSTPTGLADLSTKTGGKPLGSLVGRADQIAVADRIEKTPFFKTVRDHTIMGMFAAPQHGGNFRKAGWQQIGFDDSLNFRAPVRRL